jgi:hypothetical protein
MRFNTLRRYAGEGSGAHCQDGDGHITLAVERSGGHTTCGLLF